MKKIIAFILIAAALTSLLVGCAGDAETSEASAPTELTAETAAPTETSTQAPAPVDSAWRVALLTEGDEIASRPINQAAYDAGKAWCDAHGVPFTYYVPAERTTSTYSAMIRQAVEEGWNTLILAGRGFADAIEESAERYPQVHFIALEADSGDFDKDYVPPANVYAAAFQEQILGFLAGFAAVKLGGRHLCFLGSVKQTAVDRCGYGFLQGADAAAAALGIEREIAVEYAYADRQSADPAVTAYMEDLFRRKGVDLCFTCAAAESSVYEAAQRVAGTKIIGMDTDRAADPAYADGADTIVSSAVKNYAGVLEAALSDLIENGRWSKYAGQIVSLGLVSGEDAAANEIGLAPSTQFDDDRLTEEDYAALIADLLAGKYVVSDDVKSKPNVTIAVNYLGNVK